MMQMKRIFLIGIGVWFIGTQVASARPYDPRTDGTPYYGAGNEYNDFKTTAADCPDGYILEDRGYHEGRRRIKNNFCTTPRWYHHGGSGNFHPSLGVFELIFLP